MSDLQSVLLLIVAYMTFYYRVDNFQDRVMVSITTMIVIANVQSSINAMVPKTSYLKMIDYFLTYSFNIIVVVMIYHTYISVHIQEQFAPNEDDRQAIANLLKCRCMYLTYHIYRMNQKKVCSQKTKIGHGGGF